MRCPPALQRFDNDPGDFVGKGLQDLLDDRKAFIGELLVFGIGPGCVDEWEGNLEISGDEPVKVTRDDRIARELSDIERENRPPMERLIEMDEPPGPRFLAGSFQLLMVEIDEILHHVFHRLRPGIHGINLQTRVPHRRRGQLMQQPVIIQALRREEIRIGRLVVRREDEVTQIFRFTESRMIVPDQLGPEIPRPIKNPPAIQRGQPRALRFLQIDDKRIRLGDHVVGKLVEHLPSRVAGRRRHGDASRFFRKARQSAHASVTAVGLYCFRSSQKNP